MKHLLSLPLMCFVSVLLALSHSTASVAQDRSNEYRIEEHIGKLVLSKKKNKIFRNKGRDSTITIHIDTLIMKDRASLQFHGLKDVQLQIGYAEIGKDVVFSGIGSQNNASNFDIAINLRKFQSMYVIARGIDAMNGTRTNPNGDGGDVTFRYNPNGLVPQQEDRKAKQHLKIDASAGGRRVNPPTDVALVMSRIGMTQGGRIAGIPQGQVYSGSPGREGKVTVEALQ